MASKRKKRAAKKTAPKKSKGLTEVEEYIKSKDDALAYYIDDYSEEKFEDQFIDLENEYTRSEVIGKWALEHVIRPIFPGLTDALIDKNWVDGKDDKEIDFICVLGDDVIILQSKVYEISGSSLERTRDCIKRLGDKGAKLPDRIKSIKSDIRWNKSTFHVFYSTLGEASPKLIKDYNVDITDLPTDLGAIKPARFEILDRKNLQRKVHQLHGESSYPELIKLEIVGKSVISYEGDVPVKLLITTGDSLNEADKATNRGDLYQRNFRMGLKSPLNVKIRKSGDKAPTNFIGYNNGITILSKNSELNEKKTHILIHEPQVINGAQTIRNMQYIDAANRDKICVPLKIVETDKLNLQEGMKKDDFINGLILANNSQTALKPSDFVSNFNFHGSFKTYFSTLEIRVPGKRKRGLIYMNKQRQLEGSEKKDNVQVPFEKFTEFVCAILFDPSLLSKQSKESQYNGNEESVFFKLYGDPDTGEIRKEIDFLTMQKYAGAYFFGRVMKQLLDKKSETKKSGNKVIKGTDGKPLLIKLQDKFKSTSLTAGERGWHLYYTSRLIFERLYPEVDLFERLSQPTWAFDQDSDEYKNCKVLLKKAIVACKNSVLVHSKDHEPDTWRKRPETMDLIRQAVDDLDVDYLGSGVKPLDP